MSAWGGTGFAHLFEHMMFEGSKDANANIWVLSRRRERSFRRGRERDDERGPNNYFESVPSGSLEYVLWLESDRLAALTDVLTKEKLDNERDIVKNERRQGLENQPYGRAFMLITENVFPNGHPYAHTVIGSHEDLTAASVDDVKEFFTLLHAQQSFAGDHRRFWMRPKRSAWLRKYYGPMPPGPALDRPKSWLAGSAEKRSLK